MRTLTLLLFSLVSQTLLAQPHWETMVMANDEWHYFVGDSAPAEGWYLPTFESSQWDIAKGSFGFGDQDDSTVLNITYSLYIVTKFEVHNKALIDSLLLDIDFDDAYVAYLNGQMVSRSFNVNVDFPPFDYRLVNGHEATMYSEGNPHRTMISTEYILEGENVLAIHGINQLPSSSDFTLAPFLHAKVASNNSVYREPPAWFVNPGLAFESNLPIMAIYTNNGEVIPNEPKVTAHMELINNQDELNAFPSNSFEYDGYIGIETRGQTSQNFAKKSYGIETRLANGENNNVSLLDLPPENDWVLHGPYSDKSLIRNVLVFSLSNAMGSYAPRTKMITLFLNGSYQGVYVLMEKIKKDAARVDIATLNPEEVEGEDLTGGYIFKIDKGSEESWTSSYLSINDTPLKFRYHYPDPKDMANEQKQYLKNHVSSFEDALASDNFCDSIFGYRPYIDVQSFINFYLINEFAKNVDAYRISTYFHKDKDRNGKISPIKAGPVWDFNLSLGNANYFDAFLTSGWQSDQLTDDMAPPFWWSRLKEDPIYYDQMVSSWERYRNSILSLDRVNGMIDSLTALLSSASIHNFDTYPIMGEFVWPNYYIAESYGGEIDYLKTWIKDRMLWIDNEFGLTIDPETAIGTKQNNDDNSIVLYPNPVLNNFSIQLNEGICGSLFIEIFDGLGRKLHQEYRTLNLDSERMYFSETFVNVAMPTTGLYYLRITNKGKLVGIKLIQKK